jgi:hypothetical protein
MTSRIKAILLGGTHLAFHLITDLLYLLIID